MQINKHYLPSIALMPNSPYPLLHYRGVPTSTNPSELYDHLHINGWRIQWIYRYGSTQRSHYHSSAHECMAVLSGTATIRFGVADTSLDMDENTYGKGKENGGIEVEARAGDFFILPAGMAHKTYNTKPEAEFTLMTEGDGHHISSGDARMVLDGIELSGFTMMGAYPEGSTWDFMEGGEKQAEEFQKVWSVPRPGRDPVLGESTDGLCGLW